MCVSTISAGEIQTIKSNLKEAITLDSQLRAVLIGLSNVGHLPNSSSEYSKSLMSDERNIVPLFQRVYQTESDSRLRKGAIIALGFFDDIECYDSLVKIFVSGKSDSESRLALDILANTWWRYWKKSLPYNDDLGVRALQEIQRLDKDTFYDALAIIDRMGYKPAADYLLGIMMSNEFDRRFRYSAADSLARMQDFRLMELLSGQKDKRLPPQLQTSKYLFLAKYGTHEAVQIFIKGLFADNSEERLYAAKSLWAFEPHVLRRYFYVLAPALVDDNASVREAVMSVYNDVVSLSEDRVMIQEFESLKSKARIMSSPPPPPKENGKR